MKVKFEYDPYEDCDPFWAGYIVGFTDGEGCFTFTGTTPDYYLPVFNISQNRPRILYQTKKFFSCGRITPSATGVYYYWVCNPYDLYHKIVPFFEKYKLKVKRVEFELWKKAVRLAYRRFGNRSGLYLDEIKEIRELVQKAREGKEMSYELNLTKLKPLSEVFK